MSNEELLRSICSGDVAKVKHILDQGCNPDYIHRASNEKRSLLTHLPMFQASVKGNPKGPNGLKRLKMVKPFVNLGEIL